MQAIISPNCCQTLGLASTMQGGDVIQEITPFVIVNLPVWMTHSHLSSFLWEPAKLHLIGWPLQACPHKKTKWPTSHNYTDFSLFL